MGQPYYHIHVRTTAALNLLGGSVEVELPDGTTRVVPFSVGPFDHLRDLTTVVQEVLDIQLELFDSRS